MGGKNTHHVIYSVPKHFPHTIWQDFFFLSQAFFTDVIIILFTFPREIILSIVKIVWNLRPYRELYYCGHQPPPPSWSSATGLWTLALQRLRFAPGTVNDGWRSNIITIIVSCPSASHQQGRSLAGPAGSTISLKPQTFLSVALLSLLGLSPIPSECRINNVSAHILSMRDLSIYLSFMSRGTKQRDRMRERHLSNTC